MYLSELNALEKGKFLELVYKAANIDSSFGNKEILVLNRYKDELGLDKIPVTAKKEGLIEFFKAASVKKQKIVLFELYGMVLADDGYISEKEAAFMQEVIDAFKVTESEIADIKRAAVALEQAYAYAHKVVLE